MRLARDVAQGARGRCGAGSASVPMHRCRATLRRSPSTASGCAPRCRTTSSWRRSRRCARWPRPRWPRPMPRNAATGPGSWPTAGARATTTWCPSSSASTCPGIAKNRLQPQLSGKQRELERVEQERQEMQRRLLQSLDEQLAEQATLTRQIERQSQQILPLARQRAELSLSSYQAGRGSLPELLSARAAGAGGAPARNRPDGGAGRAARASSKP
jgi:hypothetical protein